MGFPTRACREPTSEEPRKQSLRLVKEVSLSMSWKMESLPVGGDAGERQKGVSVSGEAGGTPVPTIHPMGSGEGGGMTCGPVPEWQVAVEDAPGQPSWARVSPGSGGGGVPTGAYGVTWHLGRREALLEGIAAAVGALLHGHDLLLRRGQRRVGGHHAFHAAGQHLWE